MPDRVRLRVLMLIPDLGFGGAERCFLHLKDKLDEHHDVTAVAFERPRPSKLAERCSGPGFVYLHEPGPRPSLLGRMRRWLERFRRLKAIKQDRRVDVAISFLEGADVLNLLTRRHERIIVSVRGSKLFDPHISGLQALVRRHLVWPLVYPRADAVVSVSAGISAEVQRLGFVGSNGRSETIEVALQVPAMIESSRAAVEPHLSALARDPVIVSWGRLSDEKGYQHLLRVFARLKSQLPRARLVLVGDGPMRDGLITLAERLRLSTSTSEVPAADRDVIFTGYRDEPLRYAKLGGVFVLPSLTEGLPRALVEALAAGAMVLASDGPWGARCVLNTVAANLVDPYPTSERTFADFGVLMPRIDRPEHDACWVQALADALRGGDRYDEYRRNGPDRAMAFDESRAIASWLDLIDELSRDARSPLHQGH